MGRLAAALPLPVALAAMEAVSELKADDADAMMELLRVPVPVVRGRLLVPEPDAGDEVAGAVAVAELALPVALAGPEAEAIKTEQGWCQHREEKCNERHDSGSTKRVDVQEPQRPPWRAVAAASSAGQVL